MKNEWQLPALGSEEIGKCSYKCDSYDIIPARILHYPNLLEWRCSQLFCYMGFNLFPHCSLLPYRNFITWCLFFLFFFYPLLVLAFPLCHPSGLKWVQNTPKRAQHLCAVGRGHKPAGGVSSGVLNADMGGSQGGTPSSGAATRAAGWGHCGSPRCHRSSDKHERFPLLPKRCILLPGGRCTRFVENSAKCCIYL